ncbi:MAG: InlB B-repeat-containing protein, partial [Lawsonibacter sp.]
MKTSSPVSVINIAPYKVEHYRQNVGDDGYSIFETDSLQGQAGTVATATAKPFTGFHENTGAAGRLDSGPIALAGSLVLKLYYDRDTYTVNFDSRGGNAVSSQNGIRYEGLAVTPVAPTKTGYLFDGWYLGEDLSAAYDFSASITDSFTLYAKWAPRTDTAYKVEHYRQNVENDGYTLFETDDLQGTTDANVTATAKSYTGFHENAGTADRVASGTVAPDGSLVLKLYYDRDTYTITFDSRGGNAVPSQNGIRYEGLAVMPVAPAKTGYLFDGWYSDAELSAAYDFSAPVTDSFTLYAKWSPRTDTAYRVEHYRQNVENDGYTLFKTDDLQGTTDANVTATAKSYTGFHENAGTADRAASGTVAPDGSLVLKLYYDRDTYTVTFDTNGGDMVPSQNGIRYEGLAVTPVAPTKTGYLFDGWYSDEGLSAAYNFSTPVTDNFTFYAK